ncbi:hypothetical protein TNCV_2892341 [Trichonephila clavipes]|nr:hypothetical protein TNCV_2892341 [Trichonephila clavipes]
MESLGYASFPVTILDRQDNEEVTSRLLDIMMVQFRNEKVSNHGSIPITIDCNVVGPSSFLKKYGPMIPPAHKAHQTVSFSGCNGVYHTLVD